eukprot:scaffold33120_cov31-Phaeocystis_antarctica.AAC.1
MVSLSKGENGTRGQCKVWKDTRVEYRPEHVRILAVHHAANAPFAGRRVRSGLPQRPQWRACRRGCAAAARGGRCWRARASCRTG